MNTQTSRLRTFQLALIASAVLGLSACSKNDANVAPPVADVNAPVAVAAAPAPVPAPAPAPVVTTPAPRVVVAQNDRGYEQGRRDQERKDARQAARELPPRADRDTDVNDQQRWRHEQQAAASCVNCGVVEAVNTVVVQGETNGVGAVAGGVGGALVGNKIAGRDNHALGGVLGAVGGAIAGHAIEKHERKATAYDVTVRMEDGSRRTVRESTSPAVGEKVRVESDGLHDRS